MSDVYVYDKSKYHMGKGADTWEKASGPALFILRWMMVRDFLDPEFWGDAADSLAKYRAGQMTLFELYERECDTCLVGHQFSAEGNAFGQLYFDYDNGLYLKDLESVLHFGSGYPEYSENAYQQMGPIIDKRYNAWRRDPGAISVKKPLSRWKRWLGRRE